ncbi:MAG: 3-oxoacyl-[acyl-carrier-protein] reductase [Verrucomicrobiota bacterium]
MSRFAEKVAVVTGGGRGIGKAIAAKLAGEGAKVAVVSRNEASCAAAAAEINQTHPEAARAYAVDVADAEAVASLAKQTLEDFGKVDILVNNAGVTRDTLLMRMKDADWDTVLDTNLKGAFHTVKAFQRALMKSPAGRILNVASVIGLIGNAGQANYAASKAGLIGFTKSVARELASRGVTANALAPGFIDTEMTEVLSDEIKQGVLEKIPLKSFGAVEDIAAAAAYLASEEGRYITGQVLAIDGGMVM